jgi:hypothetical protein
VNVPDTSERDHYLRPATREELADALSLMLGDRRRQVSHPGNALALATAELLVEHLAALGFVVMVKASRDDASSRVSRVEIGGPDDPGMKPYKPVGEEPIATQ